MKKKTNPHNFRVLQQDHTNFQQIEETKAQTSQNNDNNDLLNNMTSQPVLVEEKKKKERKKLYSFKQEILASQNKGLKSLYMNIDKYKIVNNDNVEGEEFKSLHKLMRLIKDWHFSCAPKYSFEYFLNRCQEFGAKPLIKVYMNRMRQIHKGLLSWDILDENNNEENKENQNENNNFLPQELLTNNKENQNQSSEPTNKNLPASTSLNPIKKLDFNQNNNKNTNANNLNVISNNRNTDAEPIEDYEIEENNINEENDIIPVEILNAPNDFEEEVADDIDIDIGFLDLERKIKKIKPDNDFDIEYQIL